MSGSSAPHQGTIILIVISALALGGWARFCGLNLTYDSMQYLAAAASMKQSFQLLGADGKPITYWPPLFPILLTPYSNPVAAVGFLHYVLIIILGWQLWSLCKVLFLNHWLAAACMAFVLCGVHVTMISAFLWSELWFTIFLMAFVLCLVHPHQKSGLWWAAGFGFLMCLQRNAGVFMVAGAASYLFFSLPSRKQLLQSCAWFSIATSGSWAWNLYASFLIDSDFRFYQHEFGQHVLHNCRVIIHPMVRAFVPLPSNISWVAALAMAVLLLYQEKIVKDRTIRLLLSVITAYLLGMILLFRLDVHDGDRFIAVVLPLVALVTFALLARCYNNPKKIRLPIALVVAVLLTYSGFRTIKNVRLWHNMSCQAETAK